MKAFEAGYKGLISGLFFVVALVLLLLSGSATTFLIGDWTEKVFLTYDAAWRNVLYLALFAAALFFLGRVSKVEAFPWCRHAHGHPLGLREPDHP